MTRIEIEAAFKQAKDSELRILAKYWDYDHEDLEEVIDKLCAYEAKISQTDLCDYDCDIICSLIKTYTGLIVSYDELRNAK